MRADTYPLSEYPHSLTTYMSHDLPIDIWERVRFQLVLCHVSVQRHTETVGAELAETGPVPRCLSADPLFAMFVFVFV
jgi:hypothetical protein